MAAQLKCVSPYLPYPKMLPGVQTHPIEEKEVFGENMDENSVHYEGNQSSVEDMDSEEQFFSVISCLLKGKQWCLYMQRVM